MVLEKIDYQEKWFLLVLLIVVSVLYSTLGYFTTGVLNFDLSSFSINFLYSIVTLLIIRLFVNYLDRVVPWRDGVQKRFIVQVSTTLILYLIIQYLIIFLIEPSAGNQVANRTLIITSYILGVAFIFIANAIYLLLYLKYEKSIEPEKASEESATDQNFIIGTHNGSRISVLLSNIIFITIERTLTVATTDTNQRIILQESLTELEPLLDKSLFYRANRQNIITPKFIKQVEYLDNKTCAVSLSNEQQIIVSRYKAPSFKKWLK